MAEGHVHEGCWTAISVRFSHDDEFEPVAQLAADAANGLIGECAAARAAPDTVLSVAVGPNKALVDLFERLSVGEALNPKTVAGFDQVRATFAAEPERFAALAFAHVVTNPAGDPA